jgi:hypothetical protein
MVNSSQKSVFVRLRRPRGFVGFLTLVMLTALLIVMGSLLMVSRQAFVMSETIDLIRQRSVLQSSLENIVQESLLATAGLVINPVTEPIDDLIDGYLDFLNENSRGALITRAISPASLPLPYFFYPSALTPTQPILAVDWSTPGLNHGNSRFLRSGAHYLGGAVWSFTRAGSVAAETTQHPVVARFWSVPFSNWSAIAYGLPTLAADGSGTPAAAPTGAPANIRADSAETLVLTRMRASSDPTVFTELVLQPGEGEPDRLPRFYRQLVSFAWDAWEFILSPFYYDVLVTAANADLHDFEGFAPPPIPGVTVDEMDEDSLMVETNALPSSPDGRTLVVLDGRGTRRVDIVPGASSTLNTGPLVLVFRSFRGDPSDPSAQLTVNLSGIHDRTLLVYLWDSHLILTGSAEIGGGIILCPLARLSGAGVLRGTLAWHGVNPYPSPALIHTPAPSTVRTQLARIMPRALLLTTSTL